jgi:hypothetical protein
METIKTNADGHAPTKIGYYCSGSDNKNLRNNRSG